MDLGNPIKIVDHYLLIRRTTCLGYWDAFLVVSALMRIVTHWIGPMMNHDVKLSIIMIHQSTMMHKLLILRGYWAYARIDRRLWPMSETLMIRIKPLKTRYLEFIIYLMISQFHFYLFLFHVFYFMSILA